MAKIHQAVGQSQDSHQVLPRQCSVSSLGLLSPLKEPSTLRATSSPPSCPAHSISHGSLGQSGHILPAVEEAYPWLPSPMDRHAVYCLLNSWLECPHWSPCSVLPPSPRMGTRNTFHSW